MNKNRKILILTASYGNGHLQASHALQEQFEKQGAKEVITLDLMKEGHPLLNTITVSLYNKSTQVARMGLDYYGWSYYFTREAEHDAFINRSLNILGRKKLVQIIQHERPDAVVNTFPFGATPEVCKIFGIHNVTVLTDYALHSRWFHPKVDKYYVATEELQQQLIHKGLSKDRIEVTGIPIRKQFNEISSVKSANMKKRSILVMAGDSGISGYMEEIVLSLLAINESQVTVVCGRNEKVKHKLDALTPLYPNLNVLGYVNNMQEVMSEATCMVTKAGGLTLTEAISMRIPMFIFKPYAGQERENAVFLSERGVASIANNVGELAAQVQKLLDAPPLHEEVKRRMLTLQRTQAASAIANSVMDSIDQSVSLSV
ncbi:glycosyltransferase [Paenibacillus sp. GCM10027628]|uniref:MGDG synthase family glycosyltransferase n=1 Tax=Paenibacillus sp. GCM10027628 TaxID=3273413 RepID=UPI003641CEED